MKKMQHKLKRNRNPTKRTEIQGTDARAFEFDGTLPADATQADVFERSGVSQLIDAALEARQKIFLVLAVQALLCFQHEIY